MKAALSRTLASVAVLALIGVPVLGNTQYILEVKGLSCPFCAYGLEKKLKRVKNVESVSIFMEKGQATVVAKEGSEIDQGELKKAVQEAGFSLGSVKKVETEGKPGGAGK